MLAKFWQSLAFARRQTRLRVRAGRTPFPPPRFPRSVTEKPHGGLSN